MTIPISQPIKRIITCQGSAQLVTALAVLSQRETEQSAHYENYLVIYDLYAPIGQDQPFAAFIRKMAEMVCPWHRIVHLSSERMQAIAAQLDHTPPQKIYRQVWDLVGTEAAEEIYLCRNWQFGNQLLLNVYRSATKICYGDSIGVYFSATSAVVSSGTVQQQERLPFSQTIKLQVKAGLDRVRKSLALKTVLQLVEFDRGYFVLPEVFGETPPMPTVKVSPAKTLTILEKLKGVVDAKIITRFRSEIADTPVAILLTSNLSEAGRLSQENEIQAYRSFLFVQNLPSNTVLVIKPHPRDDVAKIYALKDTLSDLFHQILILTEPELFFLPFEVFFLAANIARDAKIFAVSSACLSFKLLFDVPTSIGFGDDLTTQRFDPPHAPARIEHERILNSALSQLKAAIPVYLP